MLRGMGFVASAPVQTSAQQTTSARQRQQDHAAIRRKFTGANVQELAKEYGMSARHVRRIVSEA